MAAAVEKAYQTIREGIVSGAFPPGSHLTAQGLAAASGHSRTPVREAMRRLHAEGLISLIPHRGAFVAQMEERDIQKIYDLRAVLESFAAEAAATEANEIHLTELEQLADQMAAAVRANRRDMVEEVTRLNNLFHKLIVTAAGNPRLEFALASIVELPLVLRTFRRYTLAEMRRSTDQHLELVAAFRTRDGAWARSIMTSHIHAARNALIRSLAVVEA